MKTKILPDINSYDGAPVCGWADQFARGVAKSSRQRKADNKVVLLAGDLLLVIWLLLLGSPATTCGTVVQAGGTIYTPAKGGNPPVTPTTDCCPAVNSQIGSTWYYGTDLQDEEIDTYIGNHQEQQTFYRQYVPGASFQYVSNYIVQYDCGCSGSVLNYNPTNWNNFIIGLTNTSVIATATNAVYSLQIFTPVAFSQLSLYDLQAQKLIATYSNLSVPANGSSGMTNTLPIGTVAAIAAFVPNGRLESFTPFETLSNGVAILQAERFFTTDPQSPRLSSSLALQGGQVTGVLVQRPDYSVVFGQGTMLAPLVWSGAVNSNWDIGITANWTTNGMATAYADGDFVLFDDTAVGSTTVALDSIVSPTGITFNNSLLNYTLTGLGGIGGPCNLNKTGSGTLTLGDDVFDYFDITVSNGKLIVPANGAISTFGTLAAADGATLDIQITGSGNRAAPGNVTLGVTTGSTLEFDLGTFGVPSAPPLYSSGTLQKNGTTAICVTGSGLTIGDIPLIQYETLAGSGKFVVGSLPPGVAGFIFTNTANTPNTIDLNIVSAPIDLVWSGTADGNWDINTSLNWINNGVPSVYVDGQDVLFDDSCDGPTTVNLVNHVSPLSVIFDNSVLNFTLIGSGGIEGACNLTKTGSGMLTLATLNYYTGATLLSGGTLSVSALANGGVPSSIGAARASGTNLIFNGGTLQYTGGSSTINRQFALGIGGGTIDSSGTGALALNSSFMAFIGTGPRVLTLTGTEPDNNTLAATLADYGGATALAKNGVGRWVLTGANAYSGNTIINAGVLELAQSVPTLATNSTVLIASGAMLQLDGAVTNIVTSLVVNGIAMGNGLYSNANSSSFIAGAGFLQVGTVSVGPHTPQSVVYNGIMWTALGNATINVVSNQIQVGNLGTNGQDGFMINLPTNAIGWTAEWQELDPEKTNLPTGAWLQEQLIGTAWSVTNGILTTLTSTKLGTTNYMFTTDLSPLGTNMMEIGYLNGNQVFSIPSLSPICTNFGVGDPTDYQCYWKTNFVENLGPQWAPYATVYSVNSWTRFIEYITNYVMYQQAPLVDNVAYAGPIWNGTNNPFLHLIKIRASQIPSITITSQSYTVSYGGQAWTTLGNASLNVQSNKLVIGNLGSNGADGVSLVLPTNTVNWSVQWQDLDPGEAVLAAGAYLHEQILGAVPSVTNGVLATLMSTKLATSNYVYLADVSPLATNMTGLGYVDGNQVFEVPNLPAICTNGGVGLPCDLEGYITNSGPLIIGEAENANVTVITVKDSWGHLISAETNYSNPYNQYNNPQGRSGDGSDPEVTDLGWAIGPLALGTAWPSISLAAINIQASLISTIVITNVSLGFSSTANCVSPPTNLVLWLPLDETNGTTSVNLASLANYGTRVGNPTPVLGAYVDNSLSFGGATSQYVSVPDYAGIEIGANNLTIDAWVNRATNGPDSLPSVILDKRDASSGAGYSLSVSYGHPVVTLANATGSANYVDPNAVLPADGLWHFLAVIVNQSARQVVFYIDGAVNSTLSLSSTDVANTNFLWIGGSLYGDLNNNDRHWTGKLDEVELFSRPLTTNELASIYSAGSAGKCKASCWTLNWPANKTVPCGTNWSFDTPTASSCCGGNVPITSTNTVTNGVCPQILTRTWTFTDACSNTNTCSQTVTVVDTTPPAINCPLATAAQYPVDFNTNCQLVIPKITLPATDNCTPARQLVYTQTPTNGTVEPAGVSQVLVTVTVTDLCGNSSQCAVYVIGRYPPPMVLCPTNIIVTNCLVPCMASYVTLVNSCCALPPTITQSPQCGTPTGPGANVVTVTVTDCHGNSAIKQVALSLDVSESFLGSLTNTGAATPSSSSSPVLWADGVRSIPWTLPSTALSGLGASMPSDYFGYPVAVSDVCHPTGTSCAWLNEYVDTTCYEFVPWNLPPDPTKAAAVSKWIAPDYTNNGCCPIGNYAYTLPFTLPGAFNPATATISGRWAADDTASGIMLNGNLVSGVAAPTYSKWTSFTIPASSGFVAGVNTLSFLVSNSELYTGLRVEFMSASGCSTCAPPSIAWITPGQSAMALPGATATFNVTAGGTPPFGYQWQQNNSVIPGATNSTLQLNSISNSSFGLYSVVISDPCGVVTGYTRLNYLGIHSISNLVSWPTNHMQYLPPAGWWNVALLTRPLAATIGPDLNLVGPTPATNFAINAGTTAGFGLPEEGGQIVNVMDIVPQAATSIQVPNLAASSSNSLNNYTVIMDLYEPDTSLGTPSTVFQSLACCLGSDGRDGVALTLDATNSLHLTGSAAGMPFDVASTATVPMDTWNRVAMVVEDPQDGFGVNLSGYLNGQLVVSLAVPTPVGLSINWNNSPPTLFSIQTNAASPNGEFYVSSIQFYAASLPPQTIAGMGSPDTGPLPAGNPTIGTQPVLAVTQTQGSVSFSWTGSSCVLQETASLTTGEWQDCTLPFTVAAVNGNLATTVVVTAAPNEPGKFYRLIFRP